MLSILLWTAAAVWGVSALGTMVLFGIDERAHRRSHAHESTEDVPASAPTPTAPSLLATCATS